MDRRGVSGVLAMLAASACGGATTAQTAGPPFPQPSATPYPQPPSAQDQAALIQAATAQYQAQVQASAQPGLDAVAKNQEAQRRAQEDNARAAQTAIETKQAADAACEVTPSCLAGQLCQLVAHRAGLQHAMAGERANPSGVVDLATLHDLGGDIQSTDAGIARVGAQFTKFSHRAFDPKSCASGVAPELPSAKDACERLAGVGVAAGCKVSPQSTTGGTLSFVSPTVVTPQGAAGGVVVQARTETEFSTLATAAAGDKTLRSFASPKARIIVELAPGDSFPSDVQAKVKAVVDAL